MDIHSSCCDTLTVGGISGAWNCTNVLAVEETAEDTHMLWLAYYKSEWYVFMHGK